MLLAHTMKGAAATIGAGSLADRAEELQRMASRQDPAPTDDINRGIKEFSESLDAVLSSIDSVLGDTAVQEAAGDCSADAAVPTLPKLISLGAEEYGRTRFLCGRIGEYVLQDIPATRRSMDELGVLLKDTEYYKDYGALRRCIQEFEIIAARSGEQALILAAGENLPDLILLDIMMPGMDGYQTLRELKKDPRTADIPVIFVTSLREDADESMGLDLGAVDFVSKPFNPDIIRLRIRSQLLLKRHRDNLEELVKDRDPGAEGKPFGDYPVSGPRGGIPG